MERAYQFLRREGSTALPVLRLSRPKANALNLSVVQEITEAFTDLAHDESVRAVVLTGEGHFFSAGLDVVELAGYDVAQSETFWYAFARMLETLALFPKPWVCAINGHSPAGGCILAICADHRVMAEGPYTIGLNEVPVGIVVPEPVYVLYSQWVGPGRAYQYLLQGRLLTPAEALSAGLVDAVVPPPQVLETALYTARVYENLDPDTLRKTKLNLRQAFARSVEGGFEKTFGDTLRHWWSPGARAALQALVQKLKK
ncbi:MAG: enoyl-CoA hydratase/isomerase family protein [Flavobacteriales bacterium]|nr:enoyl-CoA hydratase/isomerase family protein [Flavobacteriales bacterium]